MRIQLRFFRVASLEFQVNLYAQYRTLKHERYIAKIGTHLLLFAVSFTAQRRFIFNKQSQS